MNDVQNNDKMKVLEKAIDNMRKYMRGGAGFINKEVILNYFTDKNNTQLSLDDAIGALYENSHDIRLAEARALDVLHWMAKRFGNAEFFMDSDCPSRSKTGFKMIGPWCTYSDILRRSEAEIRKLRCMGYKTFEVFKDWFEAQGYELFTEYDLKVLDCIGFNFYGESRTIEDLRKLGVKEITIRKIEKNHMLWNPEIRVWEGNIFDRRNLEEQATEVMESQIEQHNANSDKQTKARLPRMATLINMAPEKATKYFIIGKGEEIRQQMHNELIASNSERLIRERITHYAVEMTKQQPKVKKVKLENKKLITNTDLFNIIKNNPKSIYDIDPNYIRATGDEIYNYIMISALTVKEKLDLIDYVKRVNDFKDGLKF